MFAQRGENGLAWKAFVKGKLDSDKGRMKVRLLDWGCAMERCGWKQEEMKKLMKLREEQKNLIKENDSAAVGKMLEEIERRYEGEMEKLQAELVGLLEKKAEIDEMLKALTEDEREFVELRFEKGYGFDYIGLQLHMSRATVFRLQDRTLEKLMQMEKDETT